MNRINSTIILAAIMLGTFLIFNITTTIPLTKMIDVFAAETGGEGYEIEERSYMDYPPEKEDGYSSPMMNGYYSPGPPEYNPDRYGGYYGHYESEFYLDQYVDGNPYTENSNPYENGSPYEMN